MTASSARVAVVLLWLGSVGAAEATGPQALGFSAPLLDAVRAVPSGTSKGLDAFVFPGGHDWPALRFRAPRALDWSAAAALALPVENPGSDPFELLLRVDDDPAATGDERTLNGLVTVPPHGRATVLLPLARTAGGMRGRPAAALKAEPGDLVARDIRGGVDASHVVALHVSGTRSPVDHTLLIGDPTLRPRFGAPPPGPDAPLADRYGQALAGTWPEKVGSDADLRAKLAAAALDTRRLAARLPRAADRWGGIAGAAGTATGFFRVAKLGGRWSLVTPDGHPFLSIGMDVVSPVNETVVEGRETLFTALPGNRDPLARFYGTNEGRRTLDVGGLNLVRGLGSDWRQRWPAQTVARLRAWGFNTLGAWGDPALDPLMPHVVVYDVEGGTASVPMWPGRDLPDPFDPAFATLADTAAAAMTRGRGSDAGLVGYFSGNELPWGGAGELASRVLALGPDSFAKRAFLGDLRRLYGTAASLARAWSLPGLADIATLGVPPVPRTKRAEADMAAFEERFADNYFSTVAAALKRHDPHHLYLGTRLASASPAVARACARWSDVVSVNYYGATPAERAALWRDLDRPVLIGEFHFGSLDRGSFWTGMTGVPSEADRGPAYARYLAAAVDDPAIVGVHWYQYADEPLTGRPFDGENGHLGFVSVADVPFAPFAEAAATANRAALATFASQVGASQRRSALP